jgi:cyclopropane fatty-acyl-phospholipid synthase-like methyltransferase
VERSQLEERIAALEPWHYQFEFDDGVKTPIGNPAMLNRHEQRRRYFFEPLLQLTGGSLKGRRVLDLGCNAGFWASQAMAAEADFLLGVDGRQQQLDQAELVFQAKGIDPSRYRFEQGNVFEHSFTESFDVVMCLGLMYHVAKPFELLEIMAGVGAEIMVIDTVISRANASILEVQQEPVDHWLLAVDYETVLIPSRQAVIDLAKQFGFQTVALAFNPTDRAGLAEYNNERRLAFICSKDIPLDGLRSEPVHKTLPGVPPWVAMRARRRLRKLRGR